MRKYIEWVLKNCDENCDIDVDTGPCHRCNGLGTKEDAWRAAFTIIMRKAMHIYGNDFMTDMNELYSFIRDELEE